MSEEKKTWLDRIGLIHLWATIKAALDTKVDKIPGFSLSENNYSTEDKTKLDGLTNYEHPTTPGNKHIPAGGGKDQILRWKEDGTAEWDNETPPPEYKVMTPASEESAGDSGLVPSPPVGAQNKFLRGDGTWAENENTWRPVQDNLDTDNAEDSLSAAQGKVLKGLVDGKADKEHQHELSDIPDLKDAATKMTRTATDITDSKFESAEADSKYVPDMAMLSNWNGAYNENGESNLQYCDQGRFGSMAKRTDTDFLELAGGTMTGQLSTPGVNLPPQGGIYTGNDTVYGPGGELNNIVIQSWNGVSFTSHCEAGTYGGKNQTSVGIDCREGIVKAAQFEGPADYLTGFSKRTTTQGWGTQTGTFLTGLHDSTGGDIAFRRDCPKSGQMSVIVDGRFYQNEGAQQCLDVSYLKFQTSDPGTNSSLTSGYVLFVYE